MLFSFPLSPKSAVVIPFKLIFLVNSSSHDGLSDNFSIMLPFVILWAISTLSIFILVLASWHTLNVSCLKFSPSKTLILLTSTISLLPYCSNAICCCRSSSNLFSNIFKDSTRHKFSFINCWFLGGAPTSICHFFCLSDHPSVCHTPYLRNHTSSDHNFL